MKPDSAERRGRKCETPTELWPDLQRLEREGLDLNALRKWLLDHHQIDISKPTMSRIMGKIRAAAPVGPREKLALEPVNDEDERKVLRQLARDMMNGKIDDWKQAAAGATLLLKVRAEEQKPPVPAQICEQATPGFTPTGAPTMTPELEAELVRQQLGKRVMA